MSFIYSQALVAAFSEANCLDTEQSAPLSGNPTPKPSLWHDKTMAVSRHSRYGMTCRPLTESHGAELLTWWRAGFHAKTSAWQEKGPASPENDQACGPTWRASLAKFDPVSCSWKTAQLSLLGDSELSSVTWPRSGMTANGQCWELPTLERPISGTGFGYWRTPSASLVDAKSTVTKLSGRKPTDPQVGLADQVMAAERGMWPTPTVCGNYNRKGASATSGHGLATAVYATPVARMWKDNGTSPAELARNSPKLATQAGGQLSADWTEWLMGWPIGWTALKPLGTAKFRPAPQWLGELLEGLE